MDGTIIVTKSNLKFPKNADDWKFWSNNIKEKLNQFYKDEY